MTWLFQPCLFSGSGIGSLSKMSGITTKYPLAANWSAMLFWHHIINWAVRRHNKVWVIWGIRKSLQLRIDVDSHHISKQKHCFIGILWFRIGKIGIHYCLCYFQSMRIGIFGTNLQRIPSPLSTLLVIFMETLLFLSTDLQQVSPHEQLLEYNILLGGWKPFLQFLVFGAL